MKFLIPSYKRHDRVKTIDTLERLGIPSEDIYIGTQTEEEFKRYERSIGERAKVVFGKAHNCAGNRNNLLKTLQDGEYAVLMDDDVNGLARYNPKSGKYGAFEPVEKDEFARFISMAVKEMERNNVNLSGPQTGTNAMFAQSSARRGRKYHKNKVVNGGCMIVRKTSTTRYDDTFDCYDDIEASLREVAEGRGTLVFYKYCIRKAGDQKNRGGCFGIYQNGGKEKALKRLEEMYYPLAVRSKDGDAMETVPWIR